MARNISRRQAKATSSWIRMSVRQRRCRDWIDLPLGWWMSGERMVKIRQHDMALKVRSTDAHPEMAETCRVGHMIRNDTLFIEIHALIFCSCHVDRIARCFFLACSFLLGILPTISHRTPRRCFSVSLQCHSPFPKQSDSFPIPFKASKTRL